MRDDVSIDIQRGRDWGLFAVQWLRDKRWPGGQIIQVEGNPDRLYKSLDCSSGIDYVVSHGGFNYGISVRAQRKQYAYKNTFTIRMVRIGEDYTTDSEYRKTLEAIRCGGITAAYQYHCYVNRAKEDWPNNPPTEVLCYGLAKRIELFRYLRDHPEAIEFNTARDSDQEQRFGYVRFDQIADAGAMLEHHNYQPSATTDGYWDSLFANAPAK